MSIGITQKPVIGITTGDINGIGTELIIKTFKENKILDYCTPVIFSSNKVINFYKNNIGEQHFKYSGTKDLKNLIPKTVNVFNCWDEEVPINPGQLSDIAGKYAVRSLQVAVQCLKDGELDGLITNPIHKKNVQSNDFQYTGHTPYLKDKFGAKNVVMMLCAEELRVALLTEHVPINEVSKHITEAVLSEKIKIIHDSLIKDFGIDKPKIAVLGLNPHAGDDGLIGMEEKNIIIPTIEKLQKEGIFVYGTYSADSFFARQHDKVFDCVLAMYHDQGLIPFKSFDRGMGVNFTAGLPVVRTSPDHGTAFDIAGKNKADATSFCEALFNCLDIINRRKGYAENTANRLVPGSSAKWLKKSKDDIEE